MVLLGIRAVVKEDLHTFPFELVHSSSPRLPGKLVSPAPLKATESVNKLIDGIPSFHHDHPSIAIRVSPVASHINPGPKTASHISVIHDAVQRHLSPPYNGTHKVVKDQLDKSLTVSPKIDTFS